MLKKRLIFALYYSNGNFMLSRNFNLQKAGDINWLLNNYDFLKLSKAIDELIVINVNSNISNYDHFCSVLKRISQYCFVPLVAGGGIDNLNYARKLLNSGADKLIINTALYKDIKFIKKLSSLYGNQCLIASIDFRYENKNYCVYINNGKFLIKDKFKKYFKYINQLPIGELIINSIDRDGTGQGYDFSILKFINNSKKPIIVSGGAGNWKHLYDALKKKNIEGAVTSDLFNFINDGLINARIKILNSKITLANWNLQS
jgi:cyclase